MEFVDEVRNIYRTFCYISHNKGKKKTENLLWYPSRFHMFLCDEVQKFLDKETDNPYDILIISCPPQHGKELADDTPVLTRNGWKTHGQLCVGDEVLNQYGDFVKVTGVFAKVKGDCKVTFSNGEEVFCHENHEWLVYDRCTHKEHIVETKWMEERVSYGSQEKKRGRRYNFQLPIKEFVKGEEKELAVHPYVLGAWLGDGTNQQPRICGCKEDIIVLDECAKHYEVTSENIHKTTGVLYRNYKGLNFDLRRYGMCEYKERRNKHIPADYLTASLEQRLELLAGLIDTDGYADRKHNRIVFTTADEHLKDTFEELVATFGWRTTTCECKPVLSSSGVQGRKTCWQIGFNPTIDIPCRIERKHLRGFSKQRRISIASIERVEPKQGNCISVEGGIYLFGKSLLPTHNSETITATLPAWYLMRYPDRKAIIVSYGDQNATKFGKKNLDKVREWGDVFGVSLDSAKKSAKDWRIKDHEGVCISAGYGGTITSNSADLLLIDDPVKNAIQADSDTDRDKKWDDFLMSLDSRLSAGGKVILIMTRWHENDLAGMLIDTYPEICQVINLPLIAEEDDAMGRKVGEALLTEPELPKNMQKNTKWALQKKKTLMRSESGTRTWNALWQGRPTALEGNILKREWWEFYDSSDIKNMKFDKMIMTVDAAFKDKKKNDYVAIGVWAKKDNRIYMIDLFNEHLNFPNTVRKIRVVHAKYPKIRGILIERAANGEALIETLSKQSVMGVVGVNPDSSKIARVEEVSYYIEAGNVYLPRDKKIVWDFIDQCASFPNAKHDDMVDTMTMGVRRLANSRSLRQSMKETMRNDVWSRLSKPSSKKRKGDIGHDIVPI